MNSLRSVAHNAIVVYLGKVAGIVLSTLTLAITARYLGVKQLGNFSAVLTFSAVIVSITDVGLGWIVSRELPKENTAILSPLFSLKLAITAGSIFVSIMLLPLIGYNNFITRGIVLVFIFTFFSSINNFQIGVLQGMSSLRLTAYSDLLSRLVNLILTFVIARLNLGYYALLLSLNGVGFVTFLANSYFIQQFNLPKLKLTLRGLKALQYEITTMPLVATLSFLVYKTDILLLARLKPFSDDVGIYASAYRILDVAITIPAILVGAFFPVISKVYASKNKEEEIKILGLSFSAISLLASISAVAGVLFAPVVIRFVAGGAFYNAYTIVFRGHPITSGLVLQIFFIFLFFSFYGSYFSSLLIASNNQRYLIYAGLLALIFNVLSNLILIPHYSYFASAILTVLTELLLVVPSLYVLIRRKLVIINGLVLFQSLFSSIGAGFIVALLRSHWELPLLVQFLGLIFLFLCLIFVVGGESRRLFTWVIGQVKRTRVSVDNSSIKEI